MKNKTKGRILRYNPNTNNVTIELDPMDPSIQHILEQIMIESPDKYIALDFNFNVKENVKDVLRRAWYGSLGSILKHNQIYPNSENMMELDNSLRESIFPVYIDENNVPHPKRMRQMSNEELETALKTLQERYSEVDFIRY